MSRSLLLFTASRALCDRPASEAWLRAEVVEVLDQMAPGDVLLTGRACSDMVAAVEAGLRGITCVQLHTDGWRYENGAPVRRWASDEELREWGPMRAPLARNLRLAQCARKAAEAGWSVGVLALKAPWATTRGTAHTAEACEELGLPVRRETAPDDRSQAAPHTLRDAAFAAKGVVLPLSDYEKLDRGIELPGVVTTPSGMQMNLGNVKAAAPVRDLVFVDLETTGLAPKRHQLIEIGMIRTGHDGVEVRDTFEARVRLMPGAEVDATALAINGLNPHTAAWHAAAMDMEAMLIELERRLPERFHLAGHNVSFDKNFLAAAWARVGRSCPLEGVTQICTKRIAGPLVKRGVLPNAKLATLCTHFGISNEGAHGAMVDITRTIAVYRALRGAPAASSLGMEDV